MPRIKTALPVAMVGLAMAVAGWTMAQAEMQGEQQTDEMMENWMQGDLQANEVQRISEATADSPLVLHQRELGTLPTGETLVEECRAYAKEAHPLAGAGVENATLAEAESEVGPAGGQEAQEKRHWMNETERSQLEEAYAAIDYNALSPITVLGNGALLLSYESQGQTMHFVLEPAMVGPEGFITEQHVVGTLADDRVAVMECALQTQQGGAQTQPEQQPEQQPQEEPGADVVVVEP